MDNFKRKPFVGCSEKKFFFFKVSEKTEKWTYLGLCKHG
jgi:hypothetical protein